MGIQVSMRLSEERCLEKLLADTKDIRIWDLPKMKRRSVPERISIPGVDKMPGSCYRHGNTLGKSRKRVRIVRQPERLKYRQSPQHDRPRNTSFDFEGCCEAVSYGLLPGYKLGNLDCLLQIHYG